MFEKLKECFEVASIDLIEGSKIGMLPVLIDFSAKKNLLKLTDKFDAKRTAETGVKSMHLKLNDLVYKCPSAVKILKGYRVWITVKTPLMKSVPEFAEKFALGIESEGIFGDYVLKYVNCLSSYGGESILYYLIDLNNEYEIILESKLISKTAI